MPVLLDTALAKVLSTRMAVALLQNAIAQPRVPASRTKHATRTF
jgi:hypothetical protein